MSHYHKLDDIYDTLGEMKTADAVDSATLTTISTNTGYSPVGYGIDTRAGLSNPRVVSSPIFISCYRGAVDIADGTVQMMEGLLPADGEAYWNYSAAEATFQVASTNANDTIAGSGAQKVQLTVTRNIGGTQVYEVDLNGTTPVTIGTGLNAVLVEVSQCGITKSNEGTIYIGLDTSVWTAGKPSEIVGIVATDAEWIRPGNNVSHIGQFQVPLGTELYLTGYNITSDVPGGQEMELYLSRLNWDSADDTKRFDTLIARTAFNGNVGVGAFIETSRKFTQGQGIRVYVRKIAGAGAQICNAFVKGFLVVPPPP